MGTARNRGFRAGIVSTLSKTGRNGGTKFFRVSCSDVLGLQSPAQIRYICLDPGPLETNRLVDMVGAGPNQTVQQRLQLLQHLHALVSSDPEPFDRGELRQWAIRQLERCRLAGALLEDGNDWLWSEQCRDDQQWRAEYAIWHSALADYANGIVSSQ